MDQVVVTATTSRSYSHLLRVNLLDATMATDSVRTKVFVCLFVCFRLLVVVGCGGGRGRWVCDGRGREKEEPQAFYV